MRKIGVNYRTKFSTNMNSTTITIFITGVCLKSLLHGVLIITWMVEKKYIVEGLTRVIEYASPKRFTSCFLANVFY